MFYTHADFAFNREWRVAIQPYRNSFIVHIDDVYKHPYKVYEYLKDIPIKSHKSSRNSLNGLKFFDGQHHCDNRWDPCRKKLYEKILQVYHLKEDDECKIDTIGLVNQFRLVEDYPGLDYFFCPHIDNRVNLVTYLNPQADTGPGTTLYWPTPEGEKFLYKDTEHNDPWKDVSEFCPELSIFGKFNSMVCFPGQWPHSQTIIDNRYKEKTRLTEVIFF